MARLPPIHLESTHMHNIMTICYAKVLYKDQTILFSLFPNPNPLRSRSDTTMSTELNPDNTSFVLHGVEDVRFDQVRRHWHFLSIFTTHCLHPILL